MWMRGISTKKFPEHLKKFMGKVQRSLVDSWGSLDELETPIQWLLFSQGRKCKAILSIVIRKNEKNKRRYLSCAPLILRT